VWLNAICCFFFLFFIIAMAAEAKKLVDQYIADNKVVVFSKSYCPFCQMAKAALNETGVKYFVLELEDRSKI
jgi:thiol-disulfide isomerase/thioredoxin